MTFWIRFAVVLTMLAASYGLGAYLKGKFDRAAEADKLEDQIKTANEMIEKQDARAIETESKLQAARQDFANLNRKWNNIRAQKDRSICLLDADTIRVLQSAGSEGSDAR